MNVPEEMKRNNECTNDQYLWSEAKGTSNISSIETACTIRPGDLDEKLASSKVIGSDLDQEVKSTCGPQKRKGTKEVPTKRKDTKEVPAKRKRDYSYFVSEQEFNKFDVLCGRVGSLNKHSGNNIYRHIVLLNKELYFYCSKHEKKKISESIVEAIQSQDQPGRFLDKDPTSGLWFEIPDSKAVEKTSQALREGIPKLRENWTRQSMSSIEAFSETSASCEANRYSKKRRAKS